MKSVTETKNHFVFYYFFDRLTTEHILTISADEYSIAVKKFYDMLLQQYDKHQLDKIEFGCVDKEGKYFTDDNSHCKKIKSLILAGC